MLKASKSKPIPRIRMWHVKAPEGRFPRNTCPSNALPHVLRQPARHAQSPRLSNPTEALPPRGLDVTFPPGVQAADFVSFVFR